MGVTVQWREPPDRENRSFGKTVHFGGRRDAGAGYMALSDRVGPGILIVHDDGSVAWTRSVADRFNERGFTVLVPDLTGPPGGPAEPATTERAAAVVLAAGDFLVDNWHPELGLVVYRSPDSRLEGLMRRRRPDAVVAFEGPPAPGGTCPLMLHAAESREEHGEGHAPEGWSPETEVHRYPEVDPGFAEGGSSTFDEAAAALAYERSAEFFAYHLS